MSVLLTRGISLIFLFFMFGCVQKIDISYDKKGSANVDKRIENTIIRFYYYLQQKRLQKMYLMESPSFRYLYTFQRYKSYYQGFKPIRKIIFLKLEKISPFLYQSKVKILFVNGATIKKDTWVKIDSKIYHNTADPFFFPY